jgi:hypothetical protein
MEQLKHYPTIGVCGLDCGLCPRYYTTGTSRCPGCGGPGFSDKHPSCSFITCCVKTKGLEVCGECAEFPCAKFKTEQEYRRAESSSYPPGRKVLSNLVSIKEKGFNEFMKQQRQRIRLLEIMIDEYDDGRSKSFLCRAVALLDLVALRESLRRARRARADDVRGSAKILKGILEEAATCSKIELRGSKKCRRGAQASASSEQQP